MTSIIRRQCNSSHLAARLQRINHPPTIEPAQVQVDAVIVHHPFTWLTVPSGICLNSSAAILVVAGMS